MPTRKRTRRLVAVVMGGSRGAGRGIALALGDAGATVYVAGRTRRGGPAPRDGAPGTIDDTADEVGARGGQGIAVPTDATDPGQVAALFERVAAEQDRLDVLAMPPGGRRTEWTPRPNRWPPGTLRSGTCRPPSGTTRWTAARRPTSSPAAKRSA